MSEETSTPSGEGATVNELSGDTTFHSASGAATALAELRAKRNSSAEAPEATAEQELAQANPESPQGTTEGDQEAEPEVPAISPPKSWTKDLHDHWNTLDPVLQERIVARDREDQAAIKRAFNEAADERKAIKVEREAAEKARQQYEAQLPALMQSLQDAQQNSFADIRTVNDVEKLQAEDPFRFQAWQVQQMKLQAAHVENERVNREKEQAQQTEWASFVQKENELASEYIPELADKVKGPALTQRAAERLEELGFKRAELDDLASGKQKLSIYDHRIQRLIFSDLKLQDFQNAPKAVAAKPLPPVVRPGTSKPHGNSASERVQTLTEQLSNSGRMDDAVALLTARRNASRRA